MRYVRQKPRSKDFLEITTAATAAGCRINSGGNLANILAFVLVLALAINPDIAVTPTFAVTFTLNFPFTACHSPRARLVLKWY